MFLDEQLERVYMTENFDRSLPMVKSRGKAILTTLKSGNLIKANDLLQKLPDVALNELMIASHKGRNFHKYHLEAKRIIKGDKTEMQKIFVMLYGSMKGMQASIKDPTMRKSFEKILEKVSVFGKKYGPIMAASGVTVVLLTKFVAMTAGFTPLLWQILVTTNAVANLVFWLGVFFYTMKYLINIYFSLKGIK